MADDVTLPGTGEVIAADEISGAKHQRVKVEFGADNTATPVSTSDPMPVVQTGTPGLPTGASTATKQDTIIGHVDGIETVLGTIDADTSALAGAVAGSEVQVDVVGALPAGTNEVGGVNQTKVAGTAVAVNAGNLSAGVQRVTLATDQAQLTNALKVDGSAVTQPVSGPVTDTQLRATAVPVSLASLPALAAGTAAIGKLAANSGVDIGDVDVASLPGSLAGVADDAAFTVGATPVLPVGYLADQASTDSVNEGDVGAARMTLDRKQIVTLAPSADTEGYDAANNIDVDETEDAVKATAGKLHGWFWYNDGLAEVYVKYYNADVTGTTVGTTTPFLTIPIPAGSASNIEFTIGIAFSTAITVAATTAAATADTGAPATNQVVGFSLYK